MGKGNSLNRDLKTLDVLIWGASGQALVVSRMIEEQGHRVVALVDRNPERESLFAGVPLLRPEEVEPWVAESAGPLVYVAAIGGTGGRDRLELAARLEGLGLRPLTLVHNRSWVDETAILGAGSQVCAMAAVGVGARVGRQCIINTNSTVDHESILGDGVHVMPGATVAGGVTIHAAATIGSNATVLPFLDIGEDVVVGAGAVVTRSVSAGQKVVGIPARRQ